MRFGKYISLSFSLLVAAGILLSGAACMPAQSAGGSQDTIVPTRQEESSLPQELAGISLPQSMKGYELYSWQKDGEWYFTLITGTNRNKTIEEITSSENTVGGDGLLKITVQGVEDLKTVLGLLPKDETIIWPNDPGIEPGLFDRTRLTLPPLEMVEEVQEHSRQLELDLRVGW
jgi:hypothetical protein